MVAASGHRRARPFATSSRHRVADIRKTVVNVKRRADSFGSRHVVPRPLIGVVTATTFAAVIAVTAGLFRGNFTASIPVTVMSPRAGLMMNTDAKVDMLGVQVGKVASIEDLPDGNAAIHLAIDPSQLQVIPGERRSRHRLDYGFRGQVRALGSACRSVPTTHRVRAGP